MILHLAPARRRTASAALGTLVPPSLADPINWTVADRALALRLAVLGYVPLPQCGPDLATLLRAAWPDPEVRAYLQARAFACRYAALVAGEG